MKNSIISDIFYGNNSNLSNIKMSETYKKLSTQFNEKYDILKNLIEQNQLTVFEEFCKLHDEIESESIEQFFIEGVKFGIRLGIECIQEK